MLNLLAVSIVRLWHRVKPNKKRNSRIQGLAYYLSRYNAKL